MGVPWLPFRSQPLGPVFFFLLTGFSVPISSNVPEPLLQGRRQAEGTFWPADCPVTMYCKIYVYILVSVLRVLGLVGRAGQAV